MARSKTRTATKAATAAKKTTKAAGAKAKGKGGRATTKTVQESWANVSDQKRMLQYDWKVAEDHCHLSLLFASNKVELGEYGGCSPVKLEDLRMGEKNASYAIRDGGCEECWSPEVYVFRMQEAKGGDVRLVVKSWVECSCNDGEIECVEERCYYARPV